ncbi:MAG: hypothetical protein HQ564_00570, partial [Candidatus Saganbacteria bacterium]|nr:hypothetical protein [Candidatus Saganbacteria bacterium]
AVKGRAGEKKKSKDVAKAQNIIDRITPPGDLSQKFFHSHLNLNFLTEHLTGIIGEVRSLVEKYKVEDDMRP